MKSEITALRKQLEALRCEHRQTLESGAFLQNAMDSISEAFVLYDAEDRLVYCNRQFRELYGYSEEEAAPGAHFLDLGKIDIERGLVKVSAYASEHHYLNRRSDIRMLSKQTFHVQFYDGRWFQTQDQFTPDGGIVSVQTDVTDIIDKERSARESEQRLSLALTASNAGYWVRQGQHGKIFWSDGNIRLMGYEPGAVEPSYENWVKRIHPDDRSHVTGEFLENIKQKAEINLEYRIVLPGGSIRWINNLGTPILDSEGEVSVVTGIQIDISERKQAEEALRKTNSILSSVIESPDSVIIFALDTNYNYLNFNSAHATEMKKVYGSEIEIGGNILGYMSREDDRSQAAVNYQRALRGERFVCVEEYGQADSRFWYELIFNPIMDPSQQVTGFTAFCTDITARILAEKEREGLLHDTGERIKELRCMYGIAESIRTRDSLGKVFEDALLLIPPGWHYPELTCARLRFDEREYFSELFNETEWKQSADIMVAGQVRGTIDVFYLEQCPELDEGPFLNEERNLINGIANALSGAIEHMQAQRDRETAEEQLRHAHKMDAVGQLTGGIAHDFNNILGIVLGNADLLELQIMADENALKRVREIRNSAQRAAGLTKKLTRFSQFQVAEVAVVDLNQLIVDMGGLIERSITPEIEVQRCFAEDLWYVEIDAGDFQDSLINLVLNARDAMPGGGTLTLATRNSTLDEAFCAANTGSKPGDYVELTVSDSGEGIAKELRQRIFEPFYTTKEVHKGTGLGLAMVYGFAKRAEGYILVDPETRAGATFKLYLPRTEGQIRHAAVGESSEALPRGTEVVLLVDDEMELRELTRTQLESLGYRVLTAGNGQQALSVLAKEQGIDLLITDVVMPGGVNGYELAKQAMAGHPGLKMLFVSGHAEKAMAQDIPANFAANLLNKPYSYNDLARRVRELFDASGSVGGAAT